MMRISRGATPDPNPNPNPNPNPTYKVISAYKTMLLQPALPEGPEAELGPDEPGPPRTRKEERVEQG